MSAHYDNIGEASNRQLIKIALATTTHVHTSWHFGYSMQATSDISWLVSHIECVCTNVHQTG